MTSAPDTLVDKNVSLTKRKKKRHEMKQRRINDGTFINQLRGGGEIKSHRHKAPYGGEVILALMGCWMLCWLSNPQKHLPYAL